MTLGGEMKEDSIVEWIVDGARSAEPPSRCLHCRDGEERVITD